MNEDARINAIRAAHRRWLRIENYATHVAGGAASERGDDTESVYYQHLESALTPTTVEPRTRWELAS